MVSNTRTRSPAILCGERYSRTASPLRSSRHTPTGEAPTALLPSGKGALGDRLHSGAGFGVASRGGRSRPHSLLGRLRGIPNLRQPYLRARGRPVAAQAHTPDRKARWSTPSPQPSASPHAQPCRQRRLETTTLHRIVREQPETYLALAREVDPMAAACRPT